MPVWTVRIDDGDDEQVEADLLATEGGALVALSEEGLMVRAWAPGHWRTARQVPRANGVAADGERARTSVLSGLSRG